MKLNKRHRLTILFFSVIFLIYALIGVVSFAQNLEGFVIEGESLDSIMIGQSTSDEVVEKIPEPISTKTDMSNVVLDGVDVSDSIEDSSNNNSLEENNDVSETSAVKPNEDDSEKEVKSKIVKRIELVEKSGLRQCDSRFPKK